MVSFQNWIKYIIWKQGWIGDGQLLGKFLIFLQVANSLFFGRNPWNDRMLFFSPKTKLEETGKNVRIIRNKNCLCLWYSPGGKWKKHWKLLRKASFAEHIQFAKISLKIYLLGDDFLYLMYTINKDFSSTFFSLTWLPFQE